MFCFICKRSFSFILSFFCFVLIQQPETKNQAEKNIHIRKIVFFMYDWKAVETTEGVKPGAHRTLWATALEKEVDGAPGPAGCGKYVGREMSPADSSWSLVHWQALSSPQCCRVPLPSPWENGTPLQLEFLL